MAARALTISRARTLTLVVALTGVTYLTLLPMFVERLDPLTGDEPYYIVTAISLVRDGDLDEYNNYADRDYVEFYPPDPLPAGWRGWPSFPRDLPPHPAMTDLTGLHTKHGLGLSVLVAVPYELLGRIGAVLVILLAGALLTGQMYLLGLDARAPPSMALLVALGLAITMPIAPYALLIFPEVPAGLLLVYAIRRLAATQNSMLQWLGASASIGFLPWLHQRFGPTAVVLSTVLLFRLWRTNDRAASSIALIPVGVGGFSLLGYNLWLYDAPIQSSADHAGFHGPLDALNAAFGLALDAQWGLFSAAPIYLLALICIPVWWRSSRRTAMLALAAALPYLALVAAYSVWWGEWGPPARYLVPVAPLAAGPLSAWLGRASGVGRSFAGAFWSVGFGLMLIGVANPQRFYHHPDGRNQLIARIDELLQTNLSGGLVAFQPYAAAPTHERMAAALVVLAVICTLVLLIYVIPALRSTLSAGPEPIDSR